MNIIVIPDGAMIVIPLIEKNGHTYLSPVGFSKQNNTDICDGNLKFDNLSSNYITSEAPSGVKSRIFLFSKVVGKADACIIIDKTGYNSKMYGALNQLIMFGSSSCKNAHNLMLKIVKDLNIPTLTLEYPQNQKELIELINTTNKFLKGLKNVN